MLNKEWLIVIAIILLGILVILLVGVTQANQRDTTAKNVSTFVDSVGDDIRGLQEDIRPVAKVA